jgi:hypothetical protein
MTSEIVKRDAAETALDVKVAESMVIRGDVSGLGPSQRIALYLATCRELGLNPKAQPFTFLKLNGKEVMYAGRGCTDQLARLHHVTREMIDGPKVIDLAGTKLVYAVAKATLPGGRFETATATVPLVDPVNVLMKCETKAKRRATLALLGLAMLDEMELETIPASVQEPARTPTLDDLAHADDPERAAIQNEGPVEAPPQEIPPALEAFCARVAEVELPGEAVAVWMKHRTDLAPLPVLDREAAWKALCRRTEEVGKMKQAKVWLKKAIAEEDARRAAETEPRGAVAS